MQLKKHFVIMLYPFRHAIPDSGTQRYTRLQPLNEYWRPWWARHSQSALQRALDDTYFFLPYVRRLLFPETLDGDAEHQVRRVDTFARLPLQELARKLESHATLRLTYAAELLAALHPLRLEFEPKDDRGEIRDRFSAPARISWVDAVLFPQHVGFLLLKLQYDAPNVSSEQLVDFMYYARQVHQLTVDYTLPTWKRARPESTLLLTSRDLVDFLLQGIAEGERLVDPVPESFVERLYKKQLESRYTSTGPGQVYGQSFQLFSYACLTGADSGRTSGSPDELAFPMPKQPTVFESSVDETLYELATCTQVSDPVYLPDRQYARELARRGEIALWNNWKALILQDSAVFLGTQPDHFTLSILPHNIESDYFHVYLVALYQKLRLSMLSGELMRRGASLASDLGEARAVSDEFMRFRNHYWFPEVTFRPQGTELYRRYQEGLGVTPLYEAVSEAVHELKEHYENKEDHLVGDLLFYLEVIAAVVVPAEILSHVFNEQLRMLAEERLPWLAEFAYWYVPIAMLLAVATFLFALGSVVRGRYR